MVLLAISPAPSSQIIVVMFVFTGGYFISEQQKVLDDIGRELATLTTNCKLDGVSIGSFY